MGVEPPAEARSVHVPVATHDESQSSAPRMSEDSSSERAVVRPSAEVRRSVGEISGEGASSSMRASSSRKAALAYLWGKGPA